MPKTEETWMDGITTEMMEHICDNLCKYPDQLSEMEQEGEIAMMGRCKLTSICGHDYCCIECPENEVCKEQCARMDRYEYCVECPEYEEVE